MGEDAGDEQAPNVGRRRRWEDVGKGVAEAREAQTKGIRVF